MAAWVSTVNEGAVRNTRDVNLMIERGDLAAVRVALEQAGFVYRHVGGLDVFLDGVNGSARDAVHVIFAHEWVREGEPLPNPGLDAAKQAGEFRLLDLESLVQIKLTAYRDKDRTHLRDMIEVGLIDASWVKQLPVPLAERLQKLLDDPHG